MAVFGVIASEKLDFLRYSRMPEISAQRKCMEYCFPPGQIVYEEDRQSALRLSGGKLAGLGWFATYDGHGNIVGYGIDLHSMVSPAFGLQGGPLFNPGNDPLFTHALTSTTGKKRFVFIVIHPIFTVRRVSESGWLPGNKENDKVIDWAVIAPATLTSRSMVLKMGSWGDHKLLWCGTAKPLTFYGGQTNPVDSTKLTIPFRTPEGTFEVNGELKADDGLNFSVRRAH